MALASGTAMGRDLVGARAPATALETAPASEVGLGRKWAEGWAETSE